LLLLAEPWQRCGLGRAFAALLEQAIAAWPEIARLRIGIVASNAGALAFWREQGYTETGEVKPGKPDFTADVIVLEKAIVPTVTHLLVKPLTPALGPDFLAFFDHERGSAFSDNPEWAKCYC